MDIRQTLIRLLISYDSYHPNVRIEESERQHGMSGYGGENTNNGPSYISPSLVY